MDNYCYRKREILKNKLIVIAAANIYYQQPLALLPLFLIHKTTSIIITVFTIIKG